MNIKDTRSTAMIEVMNPYITVLPVDVRSWPPPWHLRCLLLQRLLLPMWLMWCWICDERKGLGILSSIPQVC